MDIETTKTDTALTRPQLHAAWALARHYGHAWATKAVGPDDSERGAPPLRFSDLVGMDVKAAIRLVENVCRDSSDPYTPAGVRSLSEAWAGSLHGVSGTVCWVTETGGAIHLDVFSPSGAIAIQLIIKAIGRGLEALAMDVGLPCRLADLDEAGRAIQALALELIPDIEPADRQAVAAETADTILSPVRRSVAARDYQDVLDKVQQLLRDAETFEVRARDLEREALDCQLPGLWGIHALRAWAEGVLP